MERVIAAAKEFYSRAEFDGPPLTLEQLQRRVEWTEAKLWRLNEVRNRGFWGRVKWLLTGK